MPMPTTDSISKCGPGANPEVPRWILPSHLGKCRRIVRQCMTCWHCEGHLVFCPFRACSTWSWSCSKPSLALVLLAEQVTRNRRFIFLYPLCCSCSPRHVEVPLGYQTRDLQDGSSAMIWNATRQKTGVALQIARQIRTWAGQGLDGSSLYVTSSV